MAITHKGNKMLKKLLFGILIFTYSLSAANLTDILLGEDKQTVKDIILEEGYDTVLSVNAKIATREPTITKKTAFNKDFGLGNDDIMRGDALFVEDILEMMALDILQSLNTNVKGYYAANDGGGGLFNYDSSIDKSTANGGTIIDPSVSLANQGTGIGLGCWIRQYTGPVNVKWFGAKGDGTTDDTTAINNALAFLLTSGDRGVCILPSGTYRTTDTIEINGTGVRLKGGGGEKTSVIYADFTTGEAVRVKDRYSGVSNIEITASAARKAGAIQHGIRIESQDTQFFRPTHCDYKNLVIRDQPGDGILVVGACWFSTFENIQIFDNLGHGIKFDNGETTGRTWKENPGIVRMNNMVIHSNAGNGVIIGNDNDVSNRGFRFQLNNVDLYANAEAVGVRKTADQLWAFWDTSRIESCAFDGSNIANDAVVTRGMRIAGRDITVSNTRFLDVTPQAIFIDEVLGYETSGIKISNLGIFGVDLDPVIDMHANVKNITIDLGSETNITAPVNTSLTNPLNKISKVISKTTTETRNNTVALADDSELKVSLLKKERVQFRFVILYRGDATADIKFAITAPSGASIHYTPSSSLRISGGDTVTIQNTLFSATAIAYGTDASNGTRMAEIVGEVNTTGTAGDLTLQWAQAAAVVADTELLAKSYLIVHKL